MNPKVQRALKVSDALAALAHKKVTGVVRELQGAGVLTRQEGQRVVSNLSKVKKALYDSVSGEIKKMLAAKPKAKSANRKHRR